MIGRINFNNDFKGKLAERVGFEPTLQSANS